MTNREYMINLLLDGMEDESRFRRHVFDEGEASEDYMIFHSIKCPYLGNGPFALCRKEGATRKTCVKCRKNWLERIADR